MISKKAYAKVNLHLEVLNKRDDGYHNILSIMAKTQLYDLLKLKKIDLYNSTQFETNISLKCDNGAFKEEIEKIPEEDNLITKAAQLYLKKINKSAKIEFIITKNIPTGAGLGGGSSDAAAALNLLNDYFQELDNGQLIEIGKKLGADVPFCLTNKPAICEGIGEIITPINTELNYNILIVNNGLHINTQEAYGLLGKAINNKNNDKTIKKKKEKLLNILKQIYKFDLQKHFTNDFEEKVFNHYPELKELKNDILKFEPDFSIMTGSGSTIISLFKNYEKANFAKNKLEKKQALVLLTKFL